jgi:hypothetical protein
VRGRSRSGLRGPLRVALAGALFAAGCAREAPAVFPTVAALDEAPRRPDGVAIDPEGARPGVAPREHADAGLVALRTPLGVDRALAAIDALFAAIVREDAEALARLFARDAVASLPMRSGAGARSPSLASFWDQRFRRFDYGALAGEALYRAGEVDLMRDLDGGSARRPASAPPPASADDVLVRVPVVSARVGQDRLFGDELVVYLRREDEAYRIYRIVEDFQIP